MQQPDLIQDMPELPELQLITSCEARACINLCRPEGRYVNRRKLKGKGGHIVPTQTFHAGEFSLRSLTGDEDAARGFITGLVASPEHLKQMFQIRDQEAAALQKVLPELRRHNPWHGAYCTSLRQIEDLRDFIDELHEKGCIAAKVPDRMATVAGKALSEEIGSERAVLLVPAEAFERGGSYEQLRAAAQTICRAQLRQPLPQEWQDIYYGDLLDADGNSMQVLPQELKRNASFTKVSHQDPHILPKLFVRQFPYGTGAFLGAVDSIKDFKHFMLHAIHSLDGEFLDDKDGGEFLFFTYELSLKRKLYHDYVGREMRKERGMDRPSTNQELYSAQRYSGRIAELIPNSNQALAKWK